MSAAEPRPDVTEEGYLAFERAAECKHDLVNGRILERPGATAHHCQIAVNVMVQLARQLRGGPWRLYDSSLRVKVAPTGAFLYPDLSVACGNAGVAGEPNDVLPNPTVLVEVLSPSTEAFDRGAKFAHYRCLASLRHYVLIATDRVSVEVYTREGEDWRLTLAERLDAIVPLSGLGCELRAAEVYLDAEPAVAAA